MGIEQSLSDDRQEYNCAIANGRVLRARQIARRFQPDVRMNMGIEEQRVVLTLADMPTLQRLSDLAQRSAARSDSGSVINEHMLWLQRFCDSLIKEMKP